MLHKRLLVLAPAITPTPPAPPHPPTTDPPPTPPNCAGVLLRRLPLYKAAIVGSGETWGAAGLLGACKPSRISLPSTAAVPDLHPAAACAGAVATPLVVVSSCQLADVSPSFEADLYE